MIWAADDATIVGVATGTPDGGVAIIRISGPNAFGFGAELCGGLPAPREAKLRSVELPSGPERAVVIRMPGPGSFTGEDVLELHVHGGRENVSEIVEAVLALGAVAAGPGEFSRRAFRLGRLSLDQAEGIAALVGARTRAGLEQARRLVGGELGAGIRRLDGELGRLRIGVEAALDFPEDVPARPDRWRSELEAIGVELARWLAGFERGRRARERTRVVVAGPPNAGKSSLFNALLGGERAIVSDVAGTTRDYVEAELELGPFRVAMVDTAGIREAVDAIERAGVERSRGQVEGADLVVWVDADPPTAGTLPPQIRALAEADASGIGRRITVRSKSDLRAERSEDQRALQVSALSGAGVAELRARIRQWVTGAEPPWIGLARHRDRVGEAHAAIVEAVRALGTGSGEESARDGAPLELVAFHLQVASGRLREIEGRVGLGPEGGEVLDAIFSGFCIGK